MHYLYKPSIITEQTIEDIEYYKMIFEIPDSYTFPINLEFTFTEYCFGNHWLLKWIKDTEHPTGCWYGNNFQGKLNARIINKWNLRPTGGENHNKYGCYGCWVLIKQTDLHERLITNEGAGLMNSFLKNNKSEINIEMSEGIIKKALNTTCHLLMKIVILIVYLIYYFRTLSYLFYYVRIDSNTSIYNTFWF